MRGSGQRLKTTGITDVNLQAVLRDIDQRLSDLEDATFDAQTSTQAGATTTDLDTVREDLRKLQIATAHDSTNTFVASGPMHKEGIVPDPGDTHASTDRVLHASGEWVSPLNGRLMLAPAGVGGASLDQDVATLNASLAVASGLSADSILARKIEIYSQPFCQVFRSTAQTISNNTVTSVSFDKVVHGKLTASDTSTTAPFSMWSSGSNPSRLTIPTTGLWWVAGHAYWDNASGGSLRAAYISVNGTRTTYNYQPPNTSWQPTNNVQIIRRLTAGDYVELQVYQDSGGDFSLLSIEGTPVLWAYKLL